MSKFKVGDRAVCEKVEEYPDSQGWLTKGKIYKIIGFNDSHGPQVSSDDDGKPCDVGHGKFRKLGGSMSKYDELKERINNVTVWDEVTDSLFSLIGVPHHLQFIQDATSDYGHIELWIRNHKEKGDESFGYTDQCSKLKAFKQALMWFLDHSDIKKTIVGTEQKVEIEGKVYKAKIVEEV